ncbi:TetR/AcrR family transcriptional regulator [Xanthomonas hortorum]|uniref:TetR/AcrR family transcriptional regulator n=1 Tax=Xanthomonas hortorum pv. hederae TaxID=453603 RepID=A0A9X4BUP8_9XANT|nr:TetR family transcriptional regulator [Xanthomonas hortorum]MCE4372392.1 TetR/AcrR family transcriptional regulator [Xanthomonas hortorum pv. hederae]MDC8639854.1 TetR/AcrR family transcriptional regulator [Xanthomonas hortorum pv. hederae]PPU79414.1 TetR family transcriptional regulator [Xanthomonas hortorum pv. hederae]PUE99108.1 TetR/AcrR family transcriptional regulator [Xanthomonas hortorum pv. hederae]
MRVTKAQAQANRARIVETASALFRERGYDGVGVAELMAAAGFTHGGFYKHFRSKADLMAEAAAKGFSQTETRFDGVDLAAFLDSYVSRAHRDTRSDGCTMAALSGDAARQPEAIKATFAAGIENVLSNLVRAATGSGDMDQREARAQTIDMIAHAVGAIVLSRACPDDSPLADEILEACRSRILAPLSPSVASQ